jgi:hypothetical protein
VIDALLPLGTALMPIAPLCLHFVPADVPR